MRHRLTALVAVVTLTLAGACGGSSSQAAEAERDTPTVEFEQVAQTDVEEVEARVAMLESALGDLTEAVEALATKIDDIEGYSISTDLSSLEQGIEEAKACVNDLVGDLELGATYLSRCR